MNAGVYIVRCSSTGLYKIGVAGDVAKRLAALQTGSASPLELKIVLRGGAMRERALHERFADQRVRGEWFALTSADVANLREIADIESGAAHAPGDAREVWLVSGMGAEWIVLGSSEEEAIERVNASPNISLPPSSDCSFTAECIVEGHGLEDFYRSGSALVRLTDSFVHYVKPKHTNVDGKLVIVCEARDCDRPATGWCHLSCCSGETATCDEHRHEDDA